MIKITIINDGTLKIIDEYETEKGFDYVDQVTIKYDGFVTHTEKLAGQYEKYWVKKDG